MAFVDQEGEDNWIPVVVRDPDGSGDEYDAEYLTERKSVEFFMSERDPFFSIHHGKCQFPTPI